MHLDLNLATFQYIGEFGCYHFCFKQTWMGIYDYLLTFLQLSVKFWDCWLL